MIDPEEPLETQLARQGRIIDALMRRANRQHEVGSTAYGAFQSAIALQAQVWAKTRDLERTTDELRHARDDTQRMRKNLADALSAMDGGVALFTGGRLEVCNDIFQTLLPDITEILRPGLRIDACLSAMAESRHLVTVEGSFETALAQARRGRGAAVVTLVIELTGDRWYQVNFQRTGEENLVLLLTEMTRIVRRNRSEKESLIDRHADYLQAVFENMTSGVCTFSPQGEVMMYNQQFRQLLGLPYTILQKGTELGRLLDYVAQYGLISEAAEHDIAHWLDRLERQGRLRRRLRHASGRMLDLHAHRLPDGGVLLELKDVTLETRATVMLENRVIERTAELTRANAQLREQFEQKARVEEELRLAKERAEAAVSSKTRFLAAASHDLLQPINAAKLLIATLLEAVAGTRFAPTVERLEGSFNSTEQLLHSLLDISRLESADRSLTPSELCLGTLMRSVWEDQTPVAQRRGVRLDVVPSMVFVRSDPIYLLRSIQNLVVNALQYTPDGGRVLVGCRRRGNRVELQVWDTGIGINRKDQKRIFEEFARADNVPLGSGVGLGLSIVDRTCRQLGHHVRVRSKPGVGSVFSIEMDVVEGRQPVPEEPCRNDTATPQQMDHIVLLIENDPDVLFAFSQKLEQWGASVLAARGIEEALRHVADMGMPPDIILADYQLDGDETGDVAIAEVRRACGAQVPAIMITANRGNGLLKKGAAQGFSILTKPVQLSRLRALIEWKTRWQAPEG
ncbi:hybrid sensor histidine kinase/response regulator (plasmid) [Salipiger sp. CCB-MM3]|uniref:PAS-domain containing protein n=1 Tax=Salipiger sp. CCB-MM3 TaxID=1792508 RepID=UPI00080ABB75|nr:PAS-domain containing protein [Salipiger sp. CCB-MM3]ANT63479.1 hybrid sensor histidine kinase/response regulator [Salipiger sp. CCB-MM3]